MANKTNVKLHGLFTCLIVKVQFKFVLLFANLCPWNENSILLQPNFRNLLKRNGRSLFEKYKIEWPD